MRKIRTLAAAAFSIGVLATPVLACPFSNAPAPVVETAEAKKTLETAVS